MKYRILNDFETSTVCTKKIEMFDRQQNKMLQLSNLDFQTKVAQILCKLTEKHKFQN